MKITEKCGEATPLRLKDIKIGEVFECWDVGEYYRGTYIKTSDGSATGLEHGIHNANDSFGDAYRIVRLPNAYLVKGNK